MSSFKTVLKGILLATVTVPAFATDSASDSSSKQEELISAALQLAKSDDVTETLKQKTRVATAAYIENEVTHYLEPYFDSLELSIDAGDSLNGPTYELIALKAYDDDGKDDSFFFNQLSANRYDHRDTVNIGIGYRHFTPDKTWMFGVNAFYDHEFPNDHQRLGYGAEVKSSVFKLGYNLYNGISGYKTDKSGTDSKALDGYDLRADLALPYFPGAWVGYKKFTWEGDAGAQDLKGEALSLKGKLSSFLYIDAGRTFYKANSRSDDNWVRLTFHYSFGSTKAEPTLLDIAESAYKFTDIDYERYKPVQRENRIIKQKKFAATVTGN